MKRELQKNYKPLKEERIKMRQLCPIRATKFKKNINGGAWGKGYCLIIWVGVYIGTLLDQFRNMYILCTFKISTKK